MRHKNERALPGTIKLPGELAEDISVRLKPNPRSRRIVLRACAREGGFRLSHPPGTPMAEITQFLGAHTDWILAHRPTNSSPEFGSDFPFRGQEFRLVQSNSRGVRQIGSQIHIGAKRLGPALARYLKGEAEGFAAPVLEAHARALGCSIKTLRLRDPRTRWGSCSSDGAIMLSWRLIMAPEHIMEYVIAHEAAHLVVLNHGPEFWRLVAELFPNYKPARNWLRREGHALQSICFD